MKQFYPPYLLKALSKKILIFCSIGLFSFDNVVLIPYRFSSWYKDLNEFIISKNYEYIKEYLLRVKSAFYYLNNPIHQTNYLSGVFRRILVIFLIRSTYI
jgi:hypothetical protein